MAPKRKNIELASARRVKYTRHSSQPIARDETDIQRIVRPGPDSLPMELLESVADFLSLSDISSLRIVSKNLATKLFSSFVQAFFTERSFLLSDRTSMQALCELSKNARFMEHIRCLRFSTHILKEPRYLHTYWHIQPPPTRDERMLRREINRRYKNLVIEEADFRKEHLVDMLKTAFEGLKNARNALDISLTDRHYSTQRTAGLPCLPWTLKKLRDVLQIEDTSDFITSSFDTKFHHLRMVNAAYHKALYEAMAKAEFSPRALQIGLIERLNQMRGLGLSLFSPGTKLVSMSRLRSLNLAMGMYCSGCHPLHSQKRQKFIHDFAVFIAAAPKIEDLVLRLGPNIGALNTLNPECSNLFRDVFHSIATRSHVDGTALDLLYEGNLLPKLRHIHLDYHMIPFNLLLEFCRQRSETLRSVRLEHVQDGSHVRPCAANQIREAVGAVLNRHFFVSLASCYCDAEEDAGPYGGLLRNFTQGCVIRQQQINHLLY